MSETARAGPVSRALLKVRGQKGLRDDPAQDRIAMHLDDLAARLAGYRPKMGKSALARMFGGASQKSAPRGLYLWGEAGSGKTMLMDLFFHAVPVPREQRQRVHFHAFMRDVHGFIHKIRQDQAAGKVWEDTDPVRVATAAIMERGWLLCLDEFQVTDITDAMILERLFRHLFAMGAVLVATSNSAPQALYEDGLNRALFEPFIARLEARADVARLAAARDYRLCGTAGDEVWASPLGEHAAAAMERMWQSATQGAACAPRPFDLGGRILMAARGCKDMAWFSFAALCGQPLGAADYITIARNLRILFLDGIPRLEAEQRNEAARLIALVDALYEHRVRLVASAEAEPDGIYAQGPLRRMFLRCASRLEEMRRPGWP